MTHAEYLLICLAAPLLIATLLVRGETRRFIGFFTVGLLACLLGGYINAYLMRAMALAPAEATVKVVPVTEELLKALPVLAYLYAAPRRGDGVMAVALAVGLGFATMENCLLFLAYAPPSLPMALVRGFCTGVMHAVCAAALGLGIRAVRALPGVAEFGIVAALCLTATYHAIYNLLLSVPGPARVAAYVMPLATATVLLAVQGYARARQGGRAEA